MIKFLMSLAMAALIGAAIVASMNNNKLKTEKVFIEQLVRDFNAVNSSRDEVEQKKEAAKTAFQEAENAHKAVADEKTGLEDTLKKKKAEVERLNATYEGRKAKVEELKIIEEKIGNENPATIAAKYEALRDQKAKLEKDLNNVEQEAARAQDALRKSQTRIDELAKAEEKRRSSVKLQSMQADIIAINRDMGFVIINAGADQGVAPESSLLVMRGNNRIGRLRIVSVEPQVTVADIMPGSVTPGASLMVRDKVIFDTNR
jgi:septal ring factor EnvC (AmiA/AmiB activator)